MIETPARVTAVEPGYAWVESERRSACSHCVSGDRCGVSSLGKLFGTRQLRVRLPDPLGVQPGDNIVIGLSEQRLLAAASMAYLLPLLFMIATAAFGVRLGYGQSVVALSSLVALVAGLWLVGACVRRRPAAGGYQPQILRKQTASDCTIEFESVMKGDRHE